MHPLFPALLAEALAEAGPATSDAPGGLMQTLTLIVPMIAVMYFVMIRPQQKQAKEHTKFLNELVKGAEIVTQGGVIGTVVQVEDRTVTVDVGGGTKLRVLKANVVGAWQEKPVAAPAKQEKK